mmetsp:Transcript_5142/g.11307  ORF Transcript_5142/g.11307 Transcript_5142/m.11307 type:complete len:248 (+) Transcript_5142:325-1068(+)
MRAGYRMLVCQSLVERDMCLCCSCSRPSTPTSLAGCKQLAQHWVQRVVRRMWSSARRCSRKPFQQMAPEMQKTGRSLATTISTANSLSVHSGAFARLSSSVTAVISPHCATWQTCNDNCSCPKRPSHLFRRRCRLGRHPARRWSTSWSGRSTTLGWRCSRWRLTRRLRWCSSRPCTRILVRLTHGQPLGSAWLSLGRTRQPLHANGKCCSSSCRNPVLVDARSFRFALHLASICGHATYLCRKEADT